jgi:hypothetical protein
LNCRDRWFGLGHCDARVQLADETLDHLEAKARARLVKVEIFRESDTLIGYLDMKAFVAFFPGDANNLVSGLPNEIPPAATVAGIYAATDVSRGVWKAPAGFQSIPFRRRTRRKRRLSGRLAGAKPDRARPLAGAPDVRSGAEAIRYRETAPKGPEALPDIVTMGEDSLQG